MSTRSLSSCAKFCGWGSCLHILSISSHRTKCQVQSSRCYASTSSVVLFSQWGVALFCIKTIPRFALLCEIATGWRCGFDPSQQTSFGEVFVCINIPTHIVIGPPQNCPIFLTDYSPSLFCDTHGSVHLIGANWISWTNSTPICTGVPKMTSCPR